MKDLERARVACLKSEAKRVKADAVALTVAAWLGVPNDHVARLGDALIVRGDAIDRLAELNVFDE